MKKNYGQTSQLPVDHLARNMPRGPISSTEFRISANSESVFLLHFFYWRNWNLQKMMLTPPEFMKLLPLKGTKYNYSQILHKFIHLLEMHMSFYWLQGEIRVTMRPPLVFVIAEYFYVWLPHVTSFYLISIPYSWNSILWHVRTCFPKSGVPNTQNESKSS